ncbi:MAG: ABC transporter substrate-binding protein [Candidatus Rokuibacteriota bacterium]
MHALAVRVTAALVFAVAAVAGPAAEAQAPGKTIPRLAEPATVKIGLTSRPLTLAGLYVGIARGYFKEAGITNEFVAVGGLNALVGPLATGEIDIATGGASAGLFNAIQRGIRLRIVADQHTAFPGRSAIALMVRKDLADQIKTFADLKGRSIGITTRKATLELSLNRALRQAGLGPADVNLVVMPFPQINAAFGTRTLDAGYQVEPLVTAAVAKGLAVRWRGLDEMWPNLQNVFLVASEQFAGRTDVARAWMVAYVRGVRDYNDAMFKRKDRGAVIQILTEYTLVKDRATYDRMVVPGIHPDGEVDVQSIREALGDFKAAGDVTGDIDLDRVVDLSLVRYAQDVLGLYPR